MSERESSLHNARVYLAECRARRGDPISRNFYWRLFAWAQESRRRAGVEPNQRELFA